MNTENVFGSFFDRMDKIETPEILRKEPYDMGVFDEFMFEQRILNLNQLSDQDAFSFIKANIEYISNKVLNKEWKYPQVLISPKFLRAYGRTVNSMPVTHATRVCTNKICYDYMLSSQDDPTVKATVLDLSRVVNSSYIQALNGAGVPTDIAANLAMSRFSTINEKVNIRRLNFSICQQDPEIMTHQRIIWIYEKLFDKIGDLFKEIMFEYYSPEEEEDLGSSFREVYSTISLAILTIVNNLTTVDIDRLIRAYVADWEYIGRPPCRFSLISLSADYNRIQHVVERISAEGTFVP